MKNGNGWSRREKGKGRKKKRAKGDVLRGGGLGEL